MSPEEFATAALATMERHDDELRSTVSKALADWDSRRAWYGPIVDRAAELYQQDTTYPAPYSFTSTLRDVLAKTGDPNQTAGNSTERVTKWVSTYLTNLAEYAAGDSGSHKRWITKRDDRVRESHVHLDGKTIPSGSKFTCEGSKLRFPGEPVGDPSVWIECRCVLQVLKGDEMATITASGEPTSQGFEDVPAVDGPEDENGPQVDQDVQVPFHGVATVMDRPTGDRRQLASAGYSARPLPLPLFYQRATGDGHAGGTVAGQMTYLQPNEAGEVEFEGFFNTTPEAQEAIQGVAEGWLRGVSVDLDDIMVDYEQPGQDLPEDASEADVMDAMQSEVTVFKQWRVSGLTMVGIPAFHEAYIALGPRQVPHEEDGDGIHDGQTQDAYADTSTDGRKKSADKGHALPDGSFPIENVDDLKNAIQAIGRAKDPAAAKAHIKKRARALGHPELIPDGWAADTVQLADAPPFPPAKKDAPPAKDAPPSDSGDSSLVPPEGAQKEAQQGIEWAGDGKGGDGLEDATIARAKDIAAGKALTQDLVNRMHSFFARHEVDKQGTGWAPGDEGYPSAGRVAWALWGGDPGKNWADERAQTQDAPPPAQKSAGATETFADAPGRRKDGSAPTCKYGSEPATKYVLHSEGMAYIPTCDQHLSRAKSDASASTPSGSSDPSNIDRVGEYGARTSFAPGTHDGPGWITDPVPTGRIRRYWTHGEGAAKIGWGAPGDFNRCRTHLSKYIPNPEYLAGACANMHKEATGGWPGHAPTEGGSSTTERLSLLASGMKMAAAINLVASITRQRPSAAWFQNPQLAGPTPITIEGDRIFGHIAAWGTCHVGFGGTCTEAPHSLTDYAWFRLGAVETDEGLVPVGQITLGTGHADLRASQRAAAAHYDDTGTAVADIATGEDEHGIWFAGALRPGVTDEQRRELLGAKLSGDWRDVRGNLELVAALAVNTPGFGIPRLGLAASAAAQTALVAAGIVEEPAAAPVELSMREQIAQGIQEALALRDRRAALTGRTARLRALAAARREERLSHIRQRFER